jgi:glycosyltransferase involved in cell wall biosynthesis
VEWQVGALFVPFKRGDTVVVCGAPRNLSTLMLLARARITGARTVWWGQYWSATTEPHRLRLRMKLSRMADALLFYTDAEVDRFHADGWMHPGPVGALNNGIDITKIRHLRQTYDPVERGNHLLFIGRLTEKAKLNLLISALAEPGLSDCHLHVIGEGSQGHALRAQAVSMGVANRITWHGGTSDEEYIAKVANHCVAFVYPGQVGLSLIHAMAYGLPSVIHGEKLRHMPEIAAFVEGKTGDYFEPGSHTALARAIEELLLKRECLHDMAKICTAIVDQNYNTEVMARRFMAFVDAFSNEIRRVE